jgi:predicted AlkP superfamily phosphohydrolase/phosphomutase
MANQSRLKLPAALLGGGVIGLAVASFPYLPFWRTGELGHLRAYLLEIVFSFFSRVLPVPFMRWIHSPTGIILVFLIMGMGLASPLALLRKKVSSPFRIFVLSLSSVAALFGLAFLIALGKTLFFYPMTTVLSLRGAAWLGISLLASFLFGFLLFFLLKRSRTVSAFVVALIVLASTGSFLFQGRTTPAQPTRPPRQVILIGLDAANWGVMTPLIEQGRLPNIQRLVEEGTAGDLRATLKIESPVIWTSIATGARKKKHGINGFVVRRKDTGEIQPVSVSFRKVEALWDIAGRNRKTVDVVTWYGSWPAEEVRGCFVSTRIGFKGLGMRVYPPERTEEIENLGPLEPLPDSAAVARIGVHLLKKDAPDLALIYFSSLDPVQHRFWKYHAARRRSWLSSLLWGRIPPKDAADFGDSIDREYIRMDGVVGDLIKAARGEAAVFIVSDHGMGEARGPVTFNLPVLLERLGWLSFREGSQDADWSKTLVFDSTQDLGPRYLSRDLMLNSRDESPLRRNPGLYLAGDFLGKVGEKIAGLRTISGKKVFTKIRMGTEEASGLGKLVVWPNLGLKPEDEIVVGAERLRVDRVIDFDRLSGMHRLEGVFIAKGPGIKKGYRVKDASILDITPTLLYYLGLPQAKDMEGWLLTTIIDPAYLNRNPVKSIPSYETGRPRKIQLPRKSAADDKILEMLRSLGYIN